MQINIDINAAIVVDDLLYFVPLNYNKLYSLDLNTKEQTFLGDIIWEDIKTKRLYDKIIYADGKLFLIPFYAKYLTVFDIENKQFQRVDIAGDNTLNTSYMSAIVHKQYIFIFGHLSSQIIRLDTTSNEYLCVPGWKEKVKPYIFSESDGYFRNQVVKIGNIIYAPFCNANALLKLNGDTLESEIIVLGEEANGYSGICYDGNVFWLSPRRLNMYMVRWDEKRNDIAKLSVFHTDDDSFGCNGVCFEHEGVEVFTVGITDKDVQNVEGILFRYHTKLLNNIEYKIFFDQQLRKMSVEKDGVKLLDSEIYIEFQRSELRKTVFEDAVKESREIGTDIFLEVLEENETKEDSKRKNNFIGRDIYNVIRR